MALFTSIIGVMYLAVNPLETTTEPYTEFYILGPEGNASGYPTNLIVGETGQFTVGISNHEHEKMRYTVVLILENETITQWMVTVAEGETWEDTFSFTPDETGRKRLRVLLYRGEVADVSTKPYRNLRLWVNMSENDHISRKTVR